MVGMGESVIDCLVEEMRGIWDVVAEWIRSRNDSRYEGAHKESTIGKVALGVGMSYCMISLVG